ncbi:cupin domain-containing protein [Ornithinimicrobium cavernae]|uniref:cupin domain-containing protein n=1 Tax=Ornithinimicrobium cavernae TaxID=2666047 RepID=UPI000D6867EA|nr:cupin domain-containing protein [Ornithinimicrobium cavernae]
MSEQDQHSPADERLPQVIDPADVPLTLYTRPDRPGPQDRYEPGDALMRTLIANDRYELGQFECLPGESFWVDLHEDADEFLYVISGELTMLLPRRREAIVVREGQFLLNPVGTHHQAINRGPGMLKVLYCAPPGSIIEA